MRGASQLNDKHIFVATRENTADRSSGNAHGLHSDSFSAEDPSSAADGRSTSFGALGEAEVSHHDPPRQLGTTQNRAVRAYRSASGLPEALRVVLEGFTRALRTRPTGTAQKQEGAQDYFIRRRQSDCLPTAP